MNVVVQPPRINIHHTNHFISDSGSKPAQQKYHIRFKTSLDPPKRLNWTWRRKLTFFLVGGDDDALSLEPLLPVLLHPLQELLVVVRLQDGGGGGPGEGESEGGEAGGEAFPPP